MTWLMNFILEKYEITTTERIRHLLAQCLEETGLGRWLLERPWGKEWNPSIMTEEYYFNAYKEYGYIYRGSGYIN